VRADENGERLETIRIDNDPVTLAKVVAAAGEDPKWCSRPPVAGIGPRTSWPRSERTCTLPIRSGCTGQPPGQERRPRRQRPVDMLRLDMVPEAWIAPPPVREFREIVRYRAKLVMLRTGLKSQVQGVLTKEGVILNRNQLWGPKGRDHLDDLALGKSFRTRVDSLCRLIDAYTDEIKDLSAEIEGWLADDLGYAAIQSIKGVGPILAAVFIAEIGNIDRFPSPDKLCSWAGLTPRHRESDTKVYRSGSPSRAPDWSVGRPSRPSPGPETPRSPSSTPECRSAGEPTSLGWLPPANFFTSVYYGMRDGEIRCLAQAG